MDFDAHFQAFLVSTVNLKPYKLDLLDERVESIVKVFQADARMGALYKEHIPQGSWAHRTIIEPVGLLDEFDADILLHLNPVPEWEDNPKTYLQEVRAAFKRNSTYANMLQRKNRCVRIQYVNSCHVDVVPCITQSDGTQVIMTFKENEFEETNPVGFSDWMRERDDLANGNLRRVIRLMKWLRDFKNTFTCPSVIMTVILGGRIWHDGADRYSDIPTSLLAILEDLDAWLTTHPTMPLIDDPSCPGTSFNHRWDEEQYRVFKTKMHDYAVWARQAFDLQQDEPQAAIAAWQKMFGTEFAAEAVNAERASIIESKALQASAALTHANDEPPAPDEEFIHDRARIDRRYDARINAVIVDTRPRSLRKARVVRVGHQLRFRLTTDAPGPYEVWWKVRNRGVAAARAGDLRGRILRQGSAGTTQHFERTAYPGQHYVEAYVVKNGVVVASDHHEVTIIG
jgi:hypothetical protein